MMMRSILLASIASVCVAVHAASANICKDYAGRLPNVTPALCEAAQLRDMQARTVMNRTIWGRDVQADKANLKVLVIGGIHGDEMSSGALVFHWIRLALNPPADSAQRIHWRFVPVVNPDGLFAKAPKRVNANGVDLNRNFPTPNWDRDARQYWEGRTKRDPRRWPGKQPLSEPESRFVVEQMQSFKPDLIVSVHAPYAVLDFDGPFVPPSRLGRLYLDQVGIFPGSLGNYGGVHKGTPVVTIELANAARMPLDSETRQMWIDLLRWMADRLSPALARNGRVAGSATGSVQK